MLSVSEKTNEPILWKFTDRRKDGRMDGRTDPLFYLDHGYALVPIRQMPTRFILPLKNCTDIFKYIYFTLYLQQMVSNWESAIVFIDCHCLWCFFSVDNRSNQFRVYLIMTYYYCSVSYKNRVARACEPLPFLKLIIPQKNTFSWENIPTELTFANWSRKLQISWKLFGEYKSEI